MSDHNHTAAFGDFGKWVPGFDFLKGLSQPGGAPAAMPQMPSLGGWVAPTLNVEELDKRIQELKTVLFWLEQNGTALKATIQAMEVQKMTLATLQGMNVSMQQMTQAFSIPTPTPASAPVPAQPAASAQPAAQPAAKAAGKSPRAKKPAAAGQATASSAAPAGVVDPMQWWGALTQQFQTIADAAMKDAQARGADLPGMKSASELAEQAGKTLAQSTGQAQEMISQALNQGTEAWGKAAKKTGRAPTQPPTSKATRKPAAPRKAARPAAKRAR